jgi:hypothetical protein
MFNSYQETFLDIQNGNSEIIWKFGKRIQYNKSHKHSLQVAKILQRKLIYDNTQYIRYVTDFQLHIGLCMQNGHTKSMWHGKYKPELQITHISCARFEVLTTELLNIHIFWDDNAVSLCEGSWLQKITVFPSSGSVQKVQRRVNQPNLAFKGLNLHEAYVDVRRSVQPVPCTQTHSGLRHGNLTTVRGIPLKLTEFPSWLTARAWSE